ncbi:hypothetical protein HAX54_021456 [Datura stramonium]|uniref:UspA domain-containing protein n=1 Tax=Datura stramonium TaxID=4076 RepID=A0ABS8UV46_DATST|nr:hypothetical protein [Datura stramonium]
MDYSTSSKIGLKWAIENLVEEGDTIIIIHVVSSKLDPTNKQLFEDTGSPLIPFDEFKEINVSKYYGLNLIKKLLICLTLFPSLKGDSSVKGVLGRCKRETL